MNPNSGLLFAAVKYDDRNKDCVKFLNSQEIFAIRAYKGMVEKNRRKAMG